MDRDATPLLARVGAEKVNARLRSLSIEGMSVNRPCQKLIMDFLAMDYAKYGHLPPGTPVAHKTGTIAGSVDDCGIIDLPDGQGHAVLTVWTKNFLGDTADVEVLIAKIARFAYDYFYFADSAAER